jgi:nitrous oxide reductase
MPSSGLLLIKSPNHRQQAQRRRLLAACAVVGLALASGLAGVLTASPPEAVGRLTTGPFSYFPSE